MSLFLSALPLWLTAPLLVVLPTLLATWAQLWVRRRVGLKRLAANNEVAGFKFAVVGVIYAVMLAFAVIIVWERYTEAEFAVLHEAGASAALYRLAAGDEPEARTVRTAISDYLHLAIEVDWPHMAEERASGAATLALNNLYAGALRLTQSGIRPTAIQIEIYHQLDLLGDARRSRLHLAIGIMPSVLWAALIVGGALTVGFTFFFATANLHAQVLMTGILSVIVLMGLFVIVSIDHPFTGPVHVDSQPLKLVLENFSEH